MIDTYGIFKQANSLVQQCGTRNTEHIARDLGIRLYDEPEFTDLLGMYTFKWNHRLIFLNPKMDHYLRQMVIGHELGHDGRHRELAKTNGMKEFTLFNMKDTTEYEANAFAAHLLLDSDEVYRLAKQGYDIVQMAHIMNSNINLMLIKVQEMNKLEYHLRDVGMNADSLFFRKIKGDKLTET